jgi:hypothetical protein
MPVITEMPPCAKTGARCGVHSAGAPPFQDCGPHEPTPLPVIYQAPFKSRCFYITPHPDRPDRFSWGCEDCPASDVATGPTELGEQLMAHMEDCR